MLNGFPVWPREWDLTAYKYLLEEPEDILNNMQAGLTAEELQRTLVIADRHEAIKVACMLAQSGDIILIAGKGHEDYQIFSFREAFS